jgi:cell division protein FtsB
MMVVVELEAWNGRVIYHRQMDVTAQTQTVISRVATLESLYTRRKLPSQRIG